MKYLIAVTFRYLLCLAFAAGLATDALATVTNVAWYRLGENDPGGRSGNAVTNTTTDLISSNHLKQFGSPLYSSSVSAAAANQLKSSLAINFNGTSQYLSNAVVSTAIDNFGMEAWVKPNATAGGNRTIVCNGSPTASGWAFIQHGGTEFTASLGGVAGFGSGAAAAGTWTHLALVRDNGTATFYVNGVASGTSASVPIPATNGFILAVHPQFVVNTWFNGAIDEVRVFTFAAGGFSTNDLLLNRIFTLPATNITATNATLNGSANLSGFPTLAWFEWGGTTSYGNVTPPQALGSDTGNTNFSQPITGLLSAATYHFRAVGSNVLGIVTGADQSFVTSDLRPVMTTLLASNVVVETARLNGLLNPKGSPSTAWFQWGTTTNYGNATTVQGPGVGTNDLWYYQDLTSLQGATTYYFRAVGSNIYGVAFGTNQSFTTSPAQLPVVATLAATSVLGLSAKLNGSVNPTGTTTSVWFEWGKTTNYGNVTTVVAVGNGKTTLAFNRTLAALEASATYHFRAVASNLVGAVFGTNRTFTIGPANTGLDNEPNDTPGTATPLYGTNVKITANIFPEGDVDYYSFAAQAGDRVYAALMIAAPNVGSDSELRIIDSDGETVLEYDDDDGSFGTTSSSIAGVAIPSSGTYYAKVNHKSATSQIRPYDLWLRVRSGSPTPETEPNETFPGQPLPASGWVSGSLSSTFDVDYYSIALNAGDSVFLSLDLDPERDGIEWNGQLGIGPFGNPASLLTVNDAGASTNDSEALFVTVKDAGTYGISVGVAPGGGSVGTYQLSASVLPASVRPCTTYSSTDVPQTIPDGGLVNSTLTIPDNKRIGKLQVFINLNHSFMPDLDVSLTAPDGNTIGLFTDIGSTNPQNNMNLGLDDEAAIPVDSFTIFSGAIFKPELDNRLDWFRGQQAQGTWTLTIRDDAVTNSGTLNGWSLVVCEDPPLVGPPTTIYSTDFEANDGGFTHSGLQDEWQRGLPGSPPITTCNSGVNCWKTDLATNYNANASNDLFSPNINLTSVPPGAFVMLNWAMKFQIEEAQFDHAFVEVQEVGGGGALHTVWAWRGATMRETQGSLFTTIDESAGWGIYQALIGDFAGKTIRLRFHFDSDSSLQFAGWAIDDVSVKVYPGIVKSGSNVGMNFFGAPGQPYRVQYATNLTPATLWNEFNPPALFTAPAQRAFGFTDTNAPALPQRYYRLRSP